MWFTKLGIALTEAPPIRQEDTCPSREKLVKTCELENCYVGNHRIHQKHTINMLFSKSVHSMVKNAMAPRPR